MWCDATAGSRRTHRYFNARRNASFQIAVGRSMLLLNPLAPVMDLSFQRTSLIFLFCIEDKVGIDSRGKRVSRCLVVSRTERPLLAGQAPNGWRVEGQWRYHQPCTSLPVLRLFTSWENSLCDTPELCVDRPLSFHLMSSITVVVFTYLSIVQTV